MLLQIAGQFLVSEKGGVQNMTNIPKYMGDKRGDKRVTKEGTKKGGTAMLKW